MKRVEFIGTSYVGKSTLYQTISKDIKTTDSYLTEEQFRWVARKEMGLSIFLFRKIFESIIQSVGGDYNVYRNPYISEMNEQTLNSYKYTLSLCFQRESIALKGISFANNTFLRLLRRIAKYEFYESLNTEKALIAEESILHWHLIMHELLLSDKLNLPKDAVRDKGLFPKAVIYCYADKKTLLERVKLRKNSKALTRHDHGKSFEDILQRVIKKQNILLKYIRMAKPLGVSVLNLDTTNGLEENVLKIKTFLEKSDCAW